MRQAAAGNNASTARRIPARTRNAVVIEAYAKKSTPSARHDTPAVFAHPARSMRHAAKTAP